MNCSQCGGVVSPGDRFCTRCGTPVAVPSGSDVTPGGSAAPVARAGFQWKWALLAVVIFVALQFGVGIVLGVLSGGNIDLESGTALILIIVLSMACFFAGGLLTALWSPGITVREPAVGIAAAVVVTNLITRKSGLSGLALGWVIPFLLGLAGARVGEKLQARRGRP